MNRVAKGTTTVMVLLALSACGGQSGGDGPEAGAARTPTASADASAAAPPATEVAAEAALHDISEKTPGYVVGISYPPGVNKYPVLARELGAYAEQLRAELLKAVDGHGNDQPRVPCELSLAFDLLTETPRVVTVAARGSSYTGGAHGQPLVARFVWLPQQERMLTADALLDSPAGWKVVSDHVREKLLEQSLLRADADDMTPEQQQAQVRELSQMIDAGTSPEPENFSELEPVLDAGNHVIAMRFVFQPYQVGPYSDGIRTVDVPAAVLLPYVAADYRELFAQP